MRILRDLKRGDRNKLYVSDRFQETVKKYPSKVAIMFEDKKITFKELDEVSNKVANVLRSSTNLRRGDTMAIFMENCLEYVYISLALSKIGVTGAFINYNLRSDSLAHCIRIANCSGIFFTSALSEAVAEVLPNLNISDMLFHVGGKCSIPRAKSLEDEIATGSPANPPPVEGKSASGESLIRTALMEYHVICVVSGIQIRCVLSTLLGQQVSPRLAT